jgi:hypothetical protein
MLKEVMKDLRLARISSLSNEVGLYVVLLEVLLCMANSLHMWILKNSKDFFDNLKSRSFSQVSAIKTFKNPLKRNNSQSFLS